MTQKEITERAIEYAKKHKKVIADQLTSLELFPPSEDPISVFMAGSPGAGKTEFSKNLIQVIEQKKNAPALRIDGDELRNNLPEYSGSNSKLFQGAISILVEKIHDEALKKKQNFVLDGTLFQYSKALENIKRSLNKKRRVFIFYIYQKPLVAWKFTQAREKIEGRNIPKEAFIEQFCSARETVERIRAEFGEEVLIYLVRKDFEKDTIERMVEIMPGGSVDQFLPSTYTRESLATRL